MKPSLAALRLPVFTLFVSMLLAGCGGTGNSPVASPTPTPAPGNPPGTPGTPPGNGGGGGGTPQHNTFVFAENFSTGTVSEFRTNSDGTLTPVSGSPFSLGAKAITTGGTHLFVGTSTKLITYNVDPASGALTQAASTAAPPQNGTMVADTKNLYVKGTNPAGDFAIFGFTVNADGSLSAVPGSPFFWGNSCDLCGIPFFMVMSNQFLFGSMSEAGHGPGITDIFIRHAAGSLQAIASPLNTTISLALHPNGQFEYDVTGGDDMFEGNRIDNSGQVHNIFLKTDRLYNAVALNPAGTFLLVSADSGLQTYTVNQSTGDITAFGNPNAITGNTLAWTFDPTGRFVLMPRGNTDMVVLSFNQADGSLKQIQDISAGELEKPWFVAF